MGVAVGHVPWSVVERPGRPVVSNRWILSEDVAEHDHDFHEIALIAGGRGEHQSIYGRRGLRRGHVITISPGAWHAYRSCDGLTVVNACFRAQLVERELAWAVEEADLRALLWPEGTANGGVLLLELDESSTSACEALLRALQADSDGRGTRSHDIGRLLMLLGILAERVDEEMLEAAARSARARPWVSSSAALLREQYSSRWRLDTLAARFAVDPTHLARTFKATFGVPPMAYLARVRAEASAALLLRTHVSVGEIGATVGWPDPNYFARRFRAHFGVSPTAYRELHRV